MWEFLKRSNHGIGKETNDTGKNPLHSTEYEDCLKRLVKIDSSIALLEAKFKILETNHDNLRGNFNRKLKGLADNEKKEEKDLNNSETVYLG